MINVVKGDLLESNTEALVNTVNTVGVMGKGIALQFKNNYKFNYNEYVKAFKNNELEIGSMLVVREENLIDQKWIINFPTKKHWRNPSKYEYIEKGLQDLARVIKDYDIKSIAIPPLGCGNGGLDWNRVKPMIESALHDIDVEVLLYGPNPEIKQQLQKNSGSKKAKLTDSSAIALYLLFLYESIGEFSSLFVANKLMYFLQRIGEPVLQPISFKSGHYGPYSVQIGHILYNVNGVYLTGLEQNEARPFEHLNLNYGKFDEVKAYICTKLTREQRERLDRVIELIKGFESTYFVELLASVDFIRNKQKLESVDEIMKAIALWSTRKEKLYSKDYIDLASKHLDSYQETRLIE